MYLRGLAYGSAVTEADAAEAVERCAVLARQLASERQQSAALRGIADAVESGLGVRATGEEIAALQTLVLAAVRSGVQASRPSLLEVLRPVMPRLESAEGLAFPLCGCVAAWKAKQAADRRRLGSRGRGGYRTRGNPAGGGRGCTRKTIRGMKRAGIEVQPKRRTGEVVVRDPQSGRRVVMHAGRKDASRKLRSMWDSVNRPQRRRAA